MSDKPPLPSEHTTSPEVPSAEPPKSGAHDSAPDSTHPDSPAEPERRDFLAKVSSVAMTASLAAAYGGLGLVGVRYLYPASKRRTAWMYVVDLASFKKGASKPFRTPGGEKVMIARIGESDEPAAFVALSSTCPHLGCQVHWEGGKNRFFCPCHNGTFDATGVATAGPPKEAGQSLPRYPLKIDRGLLYIEVAVETLPAEGGRG